MVRDRANRVALVVDDEALLRMTATFMLQDAGYRVLEAANADEALARLRERQDISVLITDVNMPGTLNGFDLARLVERDWPSIAIVIVSGERRPAADELPRGGCFFAKPYDPDGMVRQIRSMVQ